MEKHAVFGEFTLRKLRHW